MGEFEEGAEKNLEEAKVMCDLLSIYLILWCFQFWTLSTLDDNYGERKHTKKIDGNWPTLLECLCLSITAFRFIYSI